MDRGLSLMPADDEFMSKSDAIATSWDAPPGGNESLIEVVIPEAGYYCLVVWKAKTSDLDIDGSCHLFFGNEFSGVEDTSLPSATRLRGIYPNPFKPQTTIAFDLA